LSLVRIGPQARRGRRSILDVLTCDRNAACGPIRTSPKGSAPAAPSPAVQRGARRPVLSPFGQPPIITAWTRTRVQIFVGQDTRHEIRFQQSLSDDSPAGAGAQ